MMSSLSSAVLMNYYMRHWGNYIKPAAGTRLHCDLTTEKCKFLPLGQWRKQLTQADIPTLYMCLTDTLDLVGVQLTATWSTTRRNNEEIIKTKVSNVCGAWPAY